MEFYNISIERNTNLFQEGVILPLIAGYVIGRDEKRIKQVELEELKLKVLKFLAKHKNAYISDIAEKLDVSPVKIFNAVMELKNEGAVRDTQKD